MNESKHEMWSGGDNLALEAAVKNYGFTDNQARVFVWLNKGTLQKPEDLVKHLQADPYQTIDSQSDIISAWVRRNPDFVSENS